MLKIVSMGENVRSTSPQAKNVEHGGKMFDQLAPKWKVFAFFFVPYYLTLNIGNGGCMPWKSEHWSTHINA